VRLEKAAEMMETNPYDLILAAVERRVFLFGMVNTLLQPDDDDPHDDEFLNFCLLVNPAELFINGFVTLQTLLASVGADPTIVRIRQASDEVRIDLDDIFLLRCEIDEILLSELPPDPKPIPHISLSPNQKTNTNNLNIIGALLELMTGTKGSPFANNTAIIEKILINYDDKPGLSKRNLEEKFAASKKSLLPG
jgi:hypothetical protein